MEDEYLTRCVVDTSRRTVYIYSNEGDKKTVECDTPEEFMSVLNYVREHAPVDTLSYVDPSWLWFILLVSSLLSPFVYLFII